MTYDGSNNLGPNDKLRLSLEGEVTRLKNILLDVRQALEDGRRGDAIRIIRAATQGVQTAAPASTGGRAA